ncbi:MAG: TonB-dependent receptor plug domain-containing protein [Candidatus Delongbacteria bacterium]|nr:TonB-dependent receptor plug domain-containing protein [Candidatus Delongbacteria bacterium]
MKTSHKLTNYVFYFKAWSRKPYAIFRSMGFIIHIGVLLASCSLISYPIQAQNYNNDTITISADTLPEVQIVSSEPASIMELTSVPVINTEPQTTSAQHTGEIAASLPGISVRQRGIHGIQGDISMRGSSPEQVQILLNGIPMNDPQTGHHNLNLPIPLISISTVQKHSPITGQLLGTNAFSGSLNFINLISQHNTLKIHVAGGQHSLFDASASADVITGKSKHHMAIFHSSSNGHSDNTDFNQSTAYMHNNLYLTSKLSADIQLGFTKNAFGAHGFYSDKYPTQYEKTKTELLSASINKTGKININASVYFRQHSDRFELFRESIYGFSNGYYINGKDTAKYVEGIYEPWNYYSGHNFHKTRVSGYRLFAFSRTEFGKIKTGIHHSHELILSNMLGKPRFVDEQENIRYTHQAIRDHINADMSWQSPEFAGLIASIAGMMHFTKTYGTQYYGGARLEHSLKNNINIWTGINQNMRLPSFTDLYYNGPSNIGNPDLLPEQATNVEAGFYGKFGNVALHNQLFYQMGKNMIDWVKDSSDAIFTTRNYTQLISTGNEFSFEANVNKRSLIFPWIVAIRGNYTWIHKHKPKTDMISAYAMDYLKHQAAFSMSHQVPETNFQIFWEFTFNSRNGTYTKENRECAYEPWSRTDIRFSYKFNNLLVYISAYNLFNNKIRDFGNITLPGRWIKSGIRFTLTD